MQGRFGQQKPIVITDSGLLSKEYIRLFEVAGYKYILGASLARDAVFVAKFFTFHWLLMLV